MSRERGAPVGVLAATSAFVSSSHASTLRGDRDSARTIPGEEGLTPNLEVTADLKDLGPQQWPELHVYVSKGSGSHAEPSGNG